MTVLHQGSVGLFRNMPHLGGAGELLLFMSF
uniref:Uncharacterized protein n=1 Tax=Anguilla anguilla TaxID=7936 RepID=A0A0E9TQJ3_ANGAN